VAEAIGVGKNTISSWTDNAPIGKLIKLSDFTGISMVDIVDCFRAQPIDTDPEDLSGGNQNN
jgi:hypothetical protein